MRLVNALLELASACAPCTTGSSTALEIGEVGQTDLANYFADYAGILASIS